MKVKRCVQCKEVIEEDTTSRLCKKCLALRGIRKSINYKCQPPGSCFTCPYPDCVCEIQYSTHDELEYLRCAGFRRHGG